MNVASYEDLLHVDPGLLREAVKAAEYYCFDAVNLEFEFRSSTSGMYPSWFIRVTPSCTVYLDKKPPLGHGGDFNYSLLSFIESCRKNAAEAQL